MEYGKNRSGKSQHTYIDEWINGSGAVDWTCKNFKANKKQFLELIIKHTTYTRIAVYNTFIHCDYKDTNSGKREVYYSDSKSNWEFYRYA